MNTPPGPPPPPYGYAPPPPRQRRRAKVVVALAVPVLIGMFVAAIALSPDTSAPTGEWKAGQCVTPAGRVGDQEGKAFHRTGCDASDAAAKITKMTSDLMTGVPADCPEDTDAVVGVDQSGSQRLNLASNVACVRNLTAPHPGDVGQRGGLLRPGDCLLDPGRTEHLTETPCLTSHWGTFVRWAPDVASCPKGGSYDAVPLLTAHRALCVRRGG